MVRRPIGSLTAMLCLLAVVRRWTTKTLYAVMNRQVLGCLLKVEMVESRRMSAGRWLQACEAFWWNRPGANFCERSKKWIHSTLTTSKVWLTGWQTEPVYVLSLCILRPILAYHKHWNWYPSPTVTSYHRSCIDPYFTKVACRKMYTTIWLYTLPGRVI